MSNQTTRDPERIPEVLEALNTYWTAHPDLRLGQILCNAADYAGWSDPWNLEEHEVLTYLRNTRAV